MSTAATNTSGRPATTSWYPTEEVAVRSLDFNQPIPLLDIDYDSILRKRAECRVESIPIPHLKTQVVRVPIARPRRPKVREFLFAAPDKLNLKPPGDENKGFSGLSMNSGGSLLGDASRPSSTTRIRPPKDVIKLEDRLKYILQPPLESFLSERQLEFPFKPFPYQYEGIAFLYPRHSAVLADEMGLGKTMQAITAIRLLLHRGELSRILLVCPKPLVTNWQHEFEIWAPEIPITTIEGNQETRRWKWMLDEMPVKIANYELLHRDQELFYEVNGATDFDLVVLDEAQRIKNRHSATSEAARAIRSKRHWAITGTPVENSAEDLVGIFEFLSPGYLSSDMLPRQMGRAIRDHVIRRTKDMVEIDLPPKLFRDADVELSPQQADAYYMAEKEGVVRLNELGKEKELTIQHVFELVLRLKQICNFDPISGASSKLERLEADLEETANSGRKAIVFSQWVKTLKELKGRLGRFGPLEYHGGIPSKKRDAVLEQFRNDPDAHVLLISYGAGAVGLNLQFAGYVFLFDRWWNPAVEDQAINRVHRIGSAGPVTVTRFLTHDTIEERIDRVLEEKRELFDTIFSDGRPAPKLSLNQEELFGLFDLKAA